MGKNNDFLEEYPPMWITSLSLISTHVNNLTHFILSGYEEKSDNSRRFLHPLLPVYYFLLVFCHGQYCKFEQLRPFIHPMFCCNFQSFSDGGIASRQDTHSIPSRFPLLHTNYLVPSLWFWSRAQCTANVLWYPRTHVLQSCQKWGILVGHRFFHQSFCDCRRDHNICGFPPLFCCSDLKV